MCVKNSLSVIPCIAQRRHGMTCMEALISARARDGEAEKCMETLMSMVARECGADPVALGLVW